MPLLWRCYLALVAAVVAVALNETSLLLEGVRLQTKLQALPEAKAVYATILEQNPRCADAWQLLGTVAVQEGDLAVGEKHFAHALTLETEPEKAAVVHCNLAEARRLQEKYDQHTVDHARTGMALHPTEFCRFVLARIYVGQRQPARAVSLLEAIVASRPAHSDAWHTLGLVHLSAKRLEPAARSFRRLIAVDATDPRGYIGHGLVLQAAGRLPQALEDFFRALALAPDDFHAALLVATVLHQMGRMDDAIDRYEALVARKPASAAVLNNLGAALLHAKHRNDGDAAVSYLRRAIALDPGHVQSYGNLKAYYAERGNLTQAVAMLREAYAVSGNDLYRLEEVLLLPQVYESHEHLVAARARFDASLDALLQEDLVFGDFFDVRFACRILPGKLAEIRPPFYLVYHGLNDRCLLEKLVQLYRRTVPALGFEAPQVALPRAAGCIRVGFMSKFFVRNHAHGLLLRGVLAGLDRRVFCVYLLVLPDASDTLDPRLAAAVDYVVVLSLHVASVQQDVAALALDALVFVDVMSEPLNYFVSFARLAPVQVLFWGNPTTSGNDQIDYFVSGELLEALPDGDDAYTEQVVLLAGLGIWYDPPEVPTLLGHRADYGLSPGWTIYMCAQSIFKLVPAFDEVLASILAQDPRGHVVLVHGRQAAWTAQYLSRLGRTLPTALLARVHLVPRVAGHDPYMRLLSVADVVLHPFPFGGSKTSAEAIALALPMVVYQSPLLRARMAAAFFTCMGLDRYIARTPADYIALALRLGTNATLRAEMSAVLRARSPLLWRRHDVVAEWSQFLFNAVRQARD
ncbi:methyltransferase [Achlya hypogyna]|uniref:protein O-GlcNAc transferase n=1 Tax=Achlya hypogyna TaxID=1202772 RepID=A0A1V9Z2X1_ACHHY|nr:methyltransferase [Achlya hypogyna]